jgi:hypothetical protein
MPSPPFKISLVLMDEGAKIVGVWSMVPKSHPLVRCPPLDEHFFDSYTMQLKFMEIEDCFWLETKGALFI